MSSTINPRIRFIHGDMHAGNVLVSKNKLYIFDASPFLYTGDYRYDLTSVRVNLPGHLIKDLETERVWKSFEEGYGEDLFQDADSISILKAVTARNFTNPIYQISERL